MRAGNLSANAISHNMNADFLQAVSVRSSQVKRFGRLVGRSEEESQVKRSDRNLSWIYCSCSFQADSRHTNRSFLSLYEGIHRPQTGLDNEKTSGAILINS